MEANVLLLKTINELNKYSFFIPAYQRGYRWSDKEVIDLLNDINDFIPRLVDEVTGEKTWYCLQPIVVRPRENSEYEVIDGQQRLTTIFLIWHYLNQDFVEKRRDKLFSLTYETRRNTQKFLGLLDDTNTIDDTNVDFYHISVAYKTINDWFEKETSKVISKKVRDKVEKGYIHNGGIGYYKICNRKRNR